jgi:hypothetical protein
MIPLFIEKVQKKVKADFNCKFLPRIELTFGHANMYPPDFETRQVTR